jgi:hypothetical protein
VSTPRFKVYDEVWVMHNEAPARLIVFAVIESMDYWKTATEIHYNLVSSRVGAGWGNNEGEKYSQDAVFASKEELIKSL